MEERCAAGTAIVKLFGVDAAEVAIVIIGITAIGFAVAVWSN
jgi:hypothetical protein